MSDVCSTHPDRPSTGACARCAKYTCSLCNVDVAGERYCSIVCFTEQSLAAKGKRVLIWDRPNCGMSDVSFEAETEGRLASSALRGLVQALKIGPTALIVQLRVYTISNARKVRPGCNTR